MLPAEAQIAAAATTRRIYYGWYVLAIAMVGAFLAGGLTSQVFFSVILKPLTNDLGWSRSAVTGAITLGMIAAALMAPLAGSLADRHGPRIMAPTGAVIVSVSLMLLGGVHSLLLFYVGYILARGFASSVVTGVVVQTVAVNWFRRMRGRAFGLIAMSIALGGSVGALAAQPLIDGPGWRSVFIIFPSLLLIFYVLPALLFYRRRPEDMGLLPDGDDEPARMTANRALEQTEVSWSAAEAARTSALWLLVVGQGMGTLAGGAVSFHLVAYYTDKGLSATVAATAISLYALFGAVASFIWGFLVEHVSERLLLCSAMIISSMAMAIMLPLHSAAPALAAAALFGAAGRGGGTLANMILAQYYGRDSYGRIAGMVSPFNQVALGLGPLIAALTFDFTGSYDGVFVLFSCTYVLASFLVWLARKPVQKARPALAPSP